ncbi:MAG: reverse transcriptase/maturase family protein [Propionibacteriales bacterium]|nr:reverse transcriptase/maturase family protein [Propionibacteriales bacterium]
MRGRDGVSIEAVHADLTDVVRVISTRCRAGTYSFTPYRQRLFLKGAGKAPREISIPTVRDRIALRAMADLLVALYPNSSGKLPQTGVAHAMSALRTHSYDTFVRIDVRDFYPSVDHDVLMTLLNARIKKAEVLRIIRRAIATPTAPDRSPRPKALLTSGVPQGLSISNLLAEVYMRPVDLTMDAIPRISYHRFVDDILILCSSADANEADAKCRDALKAINLSAHASTAGGKSEIGQVVDGFTYLGYVMSADRIGVRHSSIVRLESHLASIHANWYRDVTRGMNAALADQRFAWHRNLAITGCVFEGVANGWIQYFRQLDDLTLLKRLDGSVDRLAARYGTPTQPARKTFMRAYWAIKHPRSRSHAYIPNFDLYGRKEMERDLFALGEDTSKMTAQEIKDAFFRIVRRAVRDLEHDVGNLS